MARFTSFSTMVGTPRDRSRISRMGTRDQFRRLGASVTIPLSPSTAPGAPAPTAMRRLSGRPASRIRLRRASARRESSVSGASREGVAITSWASGSPRRSATASRVRVGPRSMPPMQAWRALNSMKEGRRPPREGPVPRVRTTPLRMRSGTGPPPLTRGFGLMQATALNMSNMVGVGPFITIPLLMASMGGPQSLLGWLVGAAIVICDGQVWSELGAALPGSGGSYRFLREAYDPLKWGQFMAFLFIWSFVLSGPLEIASGLIGFSQYATYLWPGLAGGGSRFVGAGVGILAMIRLARRIPFLSRLTVTLWLGTVATLAAVLT